ncbi:uncharacterized protein N7446_004353 [Penicillium canescens]|uniref:uncharacterized protein n=1 Tax=Penicillium canescens TaxID=5083 RepID=UPI0026DF7CCF|nr:uncharacterized protein N7446_004353 [Penicillium canescens]KAJ6040330.1 hypothetical protein N7444_009235 [Penicillium canescens]KAJ6067316.1 hypothetical protein N7446_004353 [Penicillium canescens]KAJ6162297.1 hypothetical protein N7485_010527 [Penicillium canescens]
MVEGLTRQSLNALVRVHPETVLYAENGGYYLKNMDDEVVAITADDLCMELDVAFASVDADVVTLDLSGGKCYEEKYLSKESKKLM